MRRHARAIFQAALDAADPARAILRHVRVERGRLVAGRWRRRLDDFDRVTVIGAGKAGASMAHAVERLLGERVSGGLINVKDGHVRKLRRIELNECGHPAPDERGVRGARRIAEMAAAAGERDLLVCLISGGASALLPYPAPPVTLAEKQTATKLLLDCGATIHEINAVRKHISAIKGGQLARLASPATVLTLILSDVIGDNLDVIGSGPTAPDESTFGSARAVLVKYGLLERAPASVTSRLDAGVRGEIEETPKQALAGVENAIVGSNRLAVDAAAAKARALGYRPLVLSTAIEGETRDVARMHAAIAREIRESGRPARPPACVISGGETTVTIRGAGLGGRNQEFVLAAAIDLAGLDGVVVLSGGTDGTDGPTDAAGAIADGRTAVGRDARRFLVENNSYRFFEDAGGLLKTGPTNTNVMDVRIMLIGRTK
ncbi:MAG: glycerate kinase type-2 family protein [Bryobacteraceae bacterium]